MQSVNEIASNGNDVQKRPEKQSLTASDIRHEYFGGCSANTFWRLRKQDDSFPAPFSLGGHPLWNRADLQRWYNAKREAA